MIRGNAMACIGALGTLERTLERLRDVPRRAADLAAPQIDAMIQEQFRAGVDPYGRPWAPLRPSTIARGRRPPPLTDTGSLRNGTRARPGRGGRAGVWIQLGAAYGYFAQVGFTVGRTRVPPRRILPQFGMPKAWTFALRQSCSQAARTAVGAA